MSRTRQLEESFSESQIKEALIAQYNLPPDAFIMFVKDKYKVTATARIKEPACIHCSADRIRERLANESG